MVADSGCLGSFDFSQPLAGGIDPLPRKKSKVIQFDSFLCCGDCSGVVVVASGPLKFTLKCVV
jgi:hypothetical protein